MQNEMNNDETDPKINAHLLELIELHWLSLSKTEKKKYA